MHQALFCKLLNKSNVNGAPGAGGLARSEANHVAGFAEALSNAVDPAEAQGNLHGFGPGDAGLAGTFLVEADEEFLEFVVMRFEPGAEIGWGWKKCWFGGMVPDRIKVCKSQHRRLRLRRGCGKPYHYKEGSHRRSRMISRAALAPLAPVRPLPGCVPEPQRNRPRMGVL